MMGVGIARLLMALSLVASGVAAGAEDIDGRRLTLGGFGTIAADYHGADGLQYRRSLAQSGGVKADNLDLTTDSLAGIQINAGWSHELEAVGQVLSTPTGRHEWRPRLTRGFLRYTPDESVMLRAGRIGYEMYPQADSSVIGYAYLTTRPQPEMFGLIGSDSFDGVDATLTYPLGPGLARAKVFGGRTSSLMMLSDTLARLSFAT